MAGKSKFVERFQEFTGSELFTPYDYHRWANLQELLKMDAKGSFPPDFNLTHAKTHLANVIQTKLALSQAGVTKDTVDEKQRRIIADTENISALAASTLRYHESGQYVYEIGPKLQDMFSHTVLDKITPEDIKLPHDCLFLDLKNCSWELWGGDLTQWHNVSGVYLRKALEFELGVDLCVLITAYDNEESSNPGDDAMLWFGFSYEGIAEHGLEGYLKLQSEKEEWTRKEYRIEHDDERYTKQRQTTLAVTRSLFNFLVYINAEDSELVQHPVQIKRRAEYLSVRNKLKKTKSPSKRRKHENKLYELSSHKRYIVAPTLEEKHAWIQSQATQVPIPMGGARSKGSEHLVAGHWKTPFRKHGERKKKWVMPYARNET
jgi:hypothetical protein